MIDVKEFIECKKCGKSVQITNMFIGFKREGGNFLAKEYVCDCGERKLDKEFINWIRRGWKFEDIK